MSGANQKQQPPSVVSQSQSRYVQAQFSSIQPPRPPTPQRTDGYHVGTPPAYVQQPPNQVNNTVQPLRAMPPTGPPTQASTPPNNDIKVQQMSQQAYVQPANIRPNPNPGYYQRAPPPTNQTRMTNHRQGQQTIYPQQSQHYVSVSVPHMFTNPVPGAHMTYFNGGSRPPAAGYPNYQMIGHSIPYAAYAQQPATGQPYFFNTPNPQLMQRSTQVPTATQNPTQPPPAAAMPMQPPMQPINQAPKNKRRSNAIPIIDPTTGRDRLIEMYEQEQDSSHPPSGESSARQTPQPPIPIINKEVQAVFAKQVAQVMGKEEPSMEELKSSTLSGHDHLGHMYIPSGQAVNHPRSDLVQQSKLQAATKEFIPASAVINAAKETTPVVSAITDAVEVTITTNKAKDRESPAKIRKQQREQQQQQFSTASSCEGSKDIREVSSSKDIVNVEKVTVGVPNPAVSAKDEIVVSKEVTSLPLVSSSSSNTSSSNNIVASIKETVSMPAPEKKSVRKDKAEKLSIINQEDNLATSETVISVSVSESTTFYSNTKSKSHSSQKGKESAANKQPPTATGNVSSNRIPSTTHPTTQISASQTSKSTGKTKMRDLNLKGASKEGTDMDAYNDNIVVTMGNNANSANDSANVATIHSNNGGGEPNETLEFVNNNFNNNVSNVNNINNNNAVVIVSASLSETVLLPDNKVDSIIVVNSSKIDNDSNIGNPAKKSSPEITEIKTASNATATIPPLNSTSSLPETKDEPDRVEPAAVTKDNLIQSKNETSLKSSLNESDEPKNVNLPETKPILPYADDQWSPMNPSGKMVYGRDFLLALKQDPKSLRRPENLPNDILRNEEKGRVGDISRFGCRGGTDFAPNFSTNSFPGKSSSQRGAIAKRKSQQGPTSGGNKGGMNNNSGKPPIRFSLSLRDDIKLSETENAWKPACLSTNLDMSEYDRKTAELYKKVRGVLNKLTPQKFSTLLDQVRSLKIDNSERLQGVIDLVFEKAVDEPNFSVAYALLCRELALMQVPSKDSKEETVNFRKLLVTRCQLEFEKHSVDESARNAKVAEIEKCEDPEKKKEMQLDLEEYDRRLRMKSVGNIRFIGELFKQTMLTVNIMQRCLHNLLETRDEESLECLCKLLTTVGRTMEQKHVDLTPIFNTMSDLADKRHSKISSRVRFMIQDVIDLRLSSWVPRRQDLNPKTIDQIQKEAENEQMMIQSMNSVPIVPRRDERGGSSNNNNKNNSGKNYSNTEDGWSTAPSRGNKTFNIQREKLKSKPPTEDAPLGSALTFGNWGRGASIKTTIPQNTNTFAALDSLSNDLNSDKRSNMGNKYNKGPYNSKGPSLERMFNRPYDDSRSGSRSNSQQRSRDNSNTSQQQQRSGPSSFVAPYNLPLKQETENSQVVTSNKPIETVALPAAAAAVETYSDEHLERLERKAINIVDEYINSCCTLEECEQDIKQTIPSSLCSQLMFGACSKFLERSENHRLRTGALIAYIVKTKTLSIEDYCKGLTSFLDECRELVIDIPTIWKYLAELIAPVLWDKSGITFKHLVLPMMQLGKSNDIKKLLASIFNLSVTTQPPRFVEEMWRTSQEALGPVLPEAEVGDFIKYNNLQVLLASTESSYDEIYSILMKFFSSKTHCDEIMNWILTNVGEKVQDVRFVRTLATACFEASISKGKLKDDLLAEKYPLLQRFTDNRPDYELACLFALQSLVNKLEHPSGLLLQCFTRLYDESVFPSDTFIQWENNSDPAEQEGKGVAIKQLTSFFCELKSAEDDSTSGEESEKGSA